MNSRISRTISPPSMLMEVMITYILYFILYSFYFSTELLDYFLNIIILNNSHSFILDACSYRNVIFNCEMSRLRSTVVKLIDLSTSSRCHLRCQFAGSASLHLFLIERYSSFFYPLLILTKDTTLFCFAKQWPMTRASSIHGGFYIINEIPPLRSG